MFEWLLLKENALSAAENSVWRESALRIILVSALLVAVIIGAISISGALKDGSTYVLVLFSGFVALQVLAILAAARRPAIGSAILIGSVYAAAFCLVYFGSYPQIARLGIVLVYAAPLLGRLFFGPRVALALMAVNVVPFLLLLHDYPLPSYPGVIASPSDQHGYDIQSLLFLFFNICLPLSVFRLLHALDVAIKRQRTATAELESSHAQYEEIFENAGFAIFLCDTRGEILKSNAQSDSLLERRHGKNEGGSNIFQLIQHKPHHMEPAVTDMAALEPQQQFQTHHGRLVLIQNVIRTSEKHTMVLLRDLAPMQRIQEELDRSKARESFLSSHDQLTQLPNRNLLLERLGEAMKDRSPRHQIALVLIRLDSVKYINDARGTLAGDALIAGFARALRQLLPAESLCARLRSALFCFTIECTHDDSTVITQIEQIRRHLPEQLPVGAEECRVDLSMAVAFSRPGETDGDQLLQRCKLALDAARQSGSRDVAVFDDDTVARIRRRLSIEQAIVMALREDEMRLVYQPKVTNQGKIVGLEALVRWHSPSLGEVSPAEFIPIAESCGAIPLITAFVLDSACAYLRQRLDAGKVCLPIAINLSANDIVRTDLVQQINNACQKYQLSTHLLEFEITETGLVGDESLAISHLEALSKKGYGITIDDFGTGYSSLQKLSRFPTRSIKIDQSFVAQIGVSEKSELIIRAVVSLARIMSCTTVAEGVETAEQEHFLKAIGCELFQGFYYYRPLEREQIDQLLMA
ncbi:diguanylate cyclase (GGDEF)-like protein [Herbaspirillum sp. Sphag1AN]|uniref:putative bifunctional diguanylate cyclase/phosphodiesterase n=1 Tax=unclassified Herbaspirillum TaxID=2624150 RepID=UPI00161F391A|nr:MULTISPECIES: GGDEF domain-containing phosphodiesterase [unclassified Herbaspirillum]MBB3213551.1 diguanylate cyclase (GGDEF)-like protein [Herbaspirillum sp. Sphag1AN]MBB3246749.1 diguanylate cyclase (GGDEF)-like protein [Herbaspirillum sp. Sphag64]